MGRSRKSETTEQPAAAPKSLFSRAKLIVACVVLAAVTAFAYAGGGWASLVYRLLLDGSFLIAWLACAAGFGAAILVVLPVSLSPVLGGEGWGEGQKNDAHSPNTSTSTNDTRTSPPLPNPLPGVPGRGSQSIDLLHLVTATALGLGIFSLATLGLGLAGWLNFATSAAMLAIGGVLGLLVFAHSSVWRDRERNEDAMKLWLRAPAGWAWLWLVAMPFLGLAVVVALMPPGLMWPEEPHGYDVVEYHLQIPREWYDANRIVPLHHNAFSFFPFNVEMHYLLAMHLRGGPWAGMYLAHFMHLAMVVLTVLAVYGFARTLSTNRAAATIASVAVATVPWLTQLGTIAYNEGGLLLFGTLAMGWAFRAVVQPSRRLGRFPVAGLLAGFACGSKLTGVPEVLFAVGGLSFVGILLTRRTSDVPLSLRLAGVATFFLAGVFAFAPWLVRNQIWAGNPVFPEAASVLGQGHFSDAQVERWAKAHSPRDDQKSIGSRFTAWWKDVWISSQYGYLLLPLGVAGGVVTLVLRKTRPGEDSPDAQPIHELGRITIAMDANTARQMFSRHLEEKKLKLTPERTLVLDAVLKTAGPFEGESLFLELSSAGHNVNRATVYRTLKNLLDTRVLKQDFEESGLSHYALHTDSDPERSTTLPYERRADVEERRGPRISRQTALFVLLTLGLFAGLSVVWLFFTHLQGRFFILGVPIAGLLAASLPWGRAAHFGAAAVLLTALVGFSSLHARFSDRVAGADLAALLGFEQLSAVFTPRVMEQVPEGAPVALAGDAKAFMYDKPGSAVYYRTVFDVDAKPGQSVIDAWVEGAPADAWIIVDPAELARFHRTYKDIPAMPAEYADRDEPFVIKPSERVGQ